MKNTDEESKVDTVVEKSPFNRYKKYILCDMKELIDLKCKQDHFGFKKQLPIKKNYSSYTSAYKDIDPDKVVSNFEIQKYQRAIAPASLDQKLLKRSLHESNNHFSQNKSHKLPNIQIGSVYNRSFHTQSLERLVKGKPKDGFFLKSQWHENPSSIYKVLIDFIKEKLYESQE